MAKFYYSNTSDKFWEYTYDEFIGHLSSNHEIFLRYGKLKIGIYPTNMQTICVGDDRFDYYSKHSILAHPIIPGKTLEDLWANIELVEVY